MLFAKGAEHSLFGFRINFICNIEIQKIPINLESSYMIGLSIWPGGINRTLIPTVQTIFYLSLGYAPASAEAVAIQSLPTYCRIYCFRSHSENLCHFLRTI